MPLYLDTFVIGNSNRFAHAASWPLLNLLLRPIILYLYMEGRIGKTHLMHAIGHYVLNNNRNAKILYVSSEEFTNELIDGIKDDKTKKFRDKS